MLVLFDLGLSAYTLWFYSS